MSIDINLFHTVNNLANRWPVLDMLGIFAAVFLLPMMAFLLVLAAFTVRRFKEEYWYEMPVKAIVAAGIAYSLRFIIGIIISRARPFMALERVRQLVPMESSYNSFPSGHAALAFALAFIVFKYDRDWGIAFLILAAFVTIGRVFTGLHFPLDILGGALVGWLGAWIIHRAEYVQWSKLEHRLKG